MTNIHDEIRAYLEAHCDSTYRAFQIKLIPNIDPATITGVRTPDLHKLAKKLAQHDEVNKFLSNTPHTLFEENQLHAFIIAETRDYDTLVARIQAFLPFVNNWATCDQLSPKGLAADPAATLMLVRNWLDSPATYTIRFGISVLLQLFLDERFDPDQPTWVVAVSSNEYYVNMMRAWYLAEALVKQPAAALPLVESETLDVWTHNKTLQKARESRRVDAEMKDYLKSLKR